MSTVATRPAAGITHRLGRKALLPLGLLGICLLYTSPSPRDS